MKAGSKYVLEEQLFHGTTRDSSEAICRQNFDFRISGTRVGTRYGQGSYFHRQASYSDSYTALEFNIRRMFLVRVLVGSYANGDSSMKRPPPKDPNQPYGDLHDSCVDDVTDPSIFVIFETSQAYPEYVIEYNKSTIVPGFYGSTGNVSVAQPVQQASPNRVLTPQRAPVPVMPSPTPKPVSTKHLVSPSVSPPARMLPVRSNPVVASPSLQTPSTPRPATSSHSTPRPATSPHSLSASTYSWNNPSAAQGLSYADVQRNSALGSSTRTSNALSTTNATIVRPGSVSTSPAITPSTTTNTNPVAPNPSPGTSNSMHSSMPYDQRPTGYVVPKTEDNKSKKCVIQWWGLKFKDTFFEGTFDEDVITGIGHWEIPEVEWIVCPCLFAVSRNFAIQTLTLITVLHVLDETVRLNSLSFKRHFCDFDMNRCRNSSCFLKVMRITCILYIAWLYRPIHYLIHCPSSRDIFVTLIWIDVEIHRMRIIDCTLWWKSVSLFIVYKLSNRYLYNLFVLLWLIYHSG